MKHTQAETAFRRAVKALGGVSDVEIQQLLLHECAQALSAIPVCSELSRVRTRLAERLQAHCTQSWIQEGDLYEVFSVLTALWSYNPACIAGDYLAGAIRRLINSETAPGGPYRSRDMVEVGANAQINLFMRLAAKPLPGINDFIHAAVTNDQVDTRLLSDTGALYLLCKTYEGIELTQFAVSHCRGPHWQTSQRIVIALAALADTLTVHEIRQMLRTVCGRQQPDGFWRGEPFFAGGPSPRFLTTAIIIETIGKYRDDPISTAPIADIQHNHRAVIQAVQRIFSSRNELLSSQALFLLHHLVQSERGIEITSLSRLFAGSLVSAVPLTDQQHQLFGSASVCGWIAYTIYDDFLDDAGVPARLPAANCAMRASLDCFKAALPGRDDFYRYVVDIFAAMDEANAWEVHSCRFTVRQGSIVISQLPDYGNGSLLAARSFAHGLAIMGVCMAQQPPYSRPVMRRIETAFRHYLIARQLSDDMHDWPEDVQLGQASYVAAAILRDMHLAPGTYDLAALLPAMKRCFRHTTMPRICARTQHHINRSRHSFEKTQLLRPASSIYSLLDPLELQVCQALDARAKSQAFSKIYS